MVKVILKRDIPKLGKKNEVKEVSDGYAKNFLIKRGLVEFATIEKIKTQELISSAERTKQQEKKSQVTILAKELKNKLIILKVKTGKKGELFAAIGEKEIETELKKDGIVAKVNLDHKLKSTGEYNIEIELGFGINSTIKVKLEPLS